MTSGCARVDARGRFRVAKVRPGRYTLYAVGADQFDQFAKGGVEVTVKATEPDEPVYVYQPETGTTVAGVSGVR